MTLIKISRGVPKYNIQIGPVDEALNYNPSAILSVTDYFEWRLMQFPLFHWIPINEIGKTWGYGPFFATKKILDFWCLEMKYEKVYVACSAGVHRSPMTVFCWLLSHRNSDNSEDIDKMFFGGGLEDISKMYFSDIKNGYIPGDLPAMYKIMDEQPEWSLMGVLQSMNKYEQITYTTSNKIILAKG